MKRKITPQPERLSDEFDRLREAISGEHSTLEDLFRELSVRDHPLIVLILSLPFLIPVPMMGLSQLLGTVMITVSVAMVMGIPPWIPERLARRPIKTDLLKNLLRHGAVLSRKLERFVCPRWPLLWKDDLVTRLHGIALALAAVMLALPGPPGTNFPPAAALILLSFGILEEDGLLIVIGYGILGLNFLMFGMIALGTVWLLEYFGFVLPVIV